MKRALALDAQQSAAGRVGQAAQLGRAGASTKLRELPQQQPQKQGGITPRAALSAQEQRRAAFPTRQGPSAIKRQDNISRDRCNPFGSAPRLRLAAAASTPMSARPALTDFDPRRIGTWSRSSTIVSRDGGGGRQLARSRSTRIQRALREYGGDRGDWVGTVLLKHYMASIIQVRVRSFGRARLPSICPLERAAPWVDGKGRARGWGSAAGGRPTHRSHPHVLKAWPPLSPLPCHPPARPTGAA